MSSLDLSLVTGFETIGADTTNTGGTSVAADASANTKGTWVQLAAATSGEASWIDVTLHVPSAAARYLVDVGIGAAASEVVLLGNLHFDTANASDEGIDYRFPVAIPAGSRIAARVQCSTGAATIRVSAVLNHGDPGGFAAPGAVTTYGADTSDSGVTAVDPGTTANTEGAWVQLTAATTDDARWLVVSIAHNAAAPSAARWLVDVATGASGSEVALLADLALGAGTGQSPQPRVFSFPVNIASGTRLAVRARSNAVASGTRILDVGLYLADAAAPAGGGGAGAHAFAAWSG